jgi:hypothetical protein
MAQVGHLLLFLQGAKPPRPVMGAGGLNGARPAAEASILCAAWAESKIELDGGVEEDNEGFIGGGSPAASILPGGGA